MFNELSDEVRKRKNHKLIGEQDSMVKLWGGTLPSKYEQYMPKNGLKVIPNLVKNAWMDLTSDIGKTPEFRGEPLNETAKEEAFVSMQERIAKSYLTHAEPSAKTLFKRIAWWLVGTGRAVVLVRPDYENQRPIISIRDPRDALPHMRMVDGTPVEIYDIIFDREISVEEAKDLGLISDEYPVPPQRQQRQQQYIRVIELIDDQNWWIVAENGAVFKEEHGLDMCPAWVFQTFSPDADGGLSLFEDQVSMMVGVSLLLTLKIAAADWAVNPIFYTKGHQGTIKIGKRVINKLAQSGEMGVVSMPPTPQVDRDIEQLVTFSNILNKNPEVRQGQAESDGQYVSAKTLEQLASALDNVVDDHWDIISAGMQWIIEVCFRMDEKNWPDVEKRISRNVGGGKGRDVYTPSKDISGRYSINLDYGFGVGGYQGFLQTLQAKEAGMLSKKAAMEAMPGVTDVDKMIREIDLEHLDEVQKANILAQAQAGQMDMVFMAELKQMVAKGKRLDEAILELQERAQEQAQQAAENQTTTPVTNPAQQAPPVQEEAPPPGLSPAAVV